MNVVLFERRGEIRLGAVQSEGPTKLSLTDDGGVRVRVPRRRVLHTLTQQIEDPRVLRRPFPPPPQDPPAPIDADLLWSSLEDERSYGLAELAQLYYGESDDAHITTLVEGITQDGSRRMAPYFRLAKGAIERVDATLRDQLLERAARQAEERELHDRLAEWFGSWGSSGSGPPADAPLDLNAELDHLRDFALEGTRAHSAGRAKRLARRLGLQPDPDRVLEGLIEAGVFPRDVNELPQRRGLATGFPAAARGEADALDAQQLPAADEDLRGRPTVAIDDAGTHEVDDAISTWEAAGEVFLAVHIARIGDRIPLGGPLDREAHRRATSVYFLSEHLPMLPPGVARVCSLDEGLDRAALSLVCRIGEDGLPDRGRFVRSTIRVDRQATYEEREDPTVLRVVDTLLPVAQALREARRAAGATAISLPPLKLTLDASGEPDARLMPTNTPSNLVVSELMVLYNARLADALAEAGTPALFRTQPQALTPPTAEPSDPLFPLILRRGLLPTRVMVTPGPHRPMGLEAYVQATSPIRRLGDLVAQRQMLALLADEPPVYDAPTLNKLRKEAHKLERRARGLEEDRRRYWICRWLLNRPGPLPGLISRGGNRPMVYLPQIDRELPCSWTEELPAGTQVTARPTSVDPRRGEALLEILAGDP